MNKKLSLIIYQLKNWLSDEQFDIKTYNDINIFPHNYTIREQRQFYQPFDIFSKNISINPNYKRKNKFKLYQASSMKLAFNQFSFLLAQLQKMFLLSAPFSQASIRELQLIVKNLLNKSNQLMQRTYNILLLGDTRVGKSSLVRRFLTDTFDQDYEPTIRINLQDKTMKINDREVTVQVVDTIGLKAEHDLPIIKRTIEAADGVFVLFDLTCKKTQEMARLWFYEVRKQRKNKDWMIVIGLGTKYDGDWEIDQDGVEAFSRQCSAEMIVTSARTGFNVYECFEMMTKKIIQIQKSMILPPNLKKNQKKESSKTIKSGKIECNLY